MGWVRRGHQCLFGGGKFIYKRGHVTTTSEGSRAGKGAPINAGTVMCVFRAGAQGDQTPHRTYRERPSRACVCADVVHSAARRRRGVDVARGRRGRSAGARRTAHGVRTSLGFRRELRTCAAPLVGSGAATVASSLAGGSSGSSGTAAEAEDMGRAPPYANAVNRRGAEAEAWRPSRRSDCMTVC